jgi:hypothetical protein
VETKQGLLVDLRKAPREVQVKAYEKDLIPYVYVDEYGEHDGLQVVETGDDADNEDDDGPPEVIARIHRGE